MIYEALTCAPGLLAICATEQPTAVALAQAAAKVKGCGGVAKALAGELLGGGWRSERRP